jgi:hypothetical protein
MWFVCAQEDLLGSVHEASKQWSVLVVDELTVRILSKACTMTEMMEAGISRKCNTTDAVLFKLRYIVLRCLFMRLRDSHVPLFALG